MELGANGVNTVGVEALLPAEIPGVFTTTPASCEKNPTDAVKSVVLLIAAVSCAFLIVMVVVDAAGFAAPVAVFC